jgi:TetR/AcrR family transcriptional regulator, cholesterol catabolism regulator
VHRRKVDVNRSIVDAATELAAEGGFDHVRQRDVAARAGITLRTLYKRFRSKEEILVASLAQNAKRLEEQIAAKPPKGKTTKKRLVAFFTLITDHMCSEPNFARAVIRAMASGVPGTAAPVLAYHQHMTGLALAALRGPSGGDSDPSEDEAELILLLLQIWFATLIGWSAGMFERDLVIAQMTRAIDRLISG